MKLYELHDDPLAAVGCEEGEWLAVWADSREEARTLYLDYLRRFSLNYSEADLAGLVPVCREAEAGPHAAFAIEPERDGPHVEGRLEVLRAIGWGSPGEERRCEQCDLYPMGLDQFQLCRGCGNCGGCGCVCEPVEREVRP